MLGLTASARIRAVTRTSIVDCQLCGVCDDPTLLRKANAMSSSVSYLIPRNVALLSPKHSNYVAFSRWHRISTYVIGLLQPHTEETFYGSS